MKWINRLYIFFLGSILAITTGFGLAAFYPQPVAPEYPSVSYTTPIPASCYSTPAQENTPECQQAIQKDKMSQQDQNEQTKKYTQDMAHFQNVNAGYTRTAIFFGVVIGAIFAIIGLGLIKISRLIANALLFGGLLTAIFTRIIISLTSLGASVTGTNNAGSTSVIEFGILAFLSIAIVAVGLFSLKEKNTN